MLTFYVIGVVIVFIFLMVVYAWEMTQTHKSICSLPIDVMTALVVSVLSWVYLFVLITALLFGWIQEKNNAKL